MTSTVNAEFQPEGWDEFIGQDLLKDRLDIAVRSARSRDRRLDHVLLDGPAGSGKSTMAELLADRMDQPMIVVAEPPTVKRLRSLLFEVEPGGFIFLDEIHTFEKATKNALLPLLESGWLGDWEFPNVTIVAGTTDPQDLSKPLIDRFVHCKYVDYTLDEMAAIVRRFAHVAKVPIGKIASYALGEAAAGVPRVARSFVIAARDLLECDRPIDTPAIMAYCNRTKDGLSTDHVAYLAALRANQGRAGLDTLSDRLQKHPTLVRDLERLLLDRGYVVRGGAGRELTGAGQQRLKAA